MTEATKHSLYELCRRAYYNTSFSPEKRAESEVAFYEGQLAEFKQLCGDDVARYEDIKAKFTAKFINHMNARSRCLSSMITGPAKFPVARAEKANNRERAAGDEVLSFIDKVKKNFDKEQNPHKHGISSDHANAIELLKDKLETTRKNHGLMIAFNAIARKKSLSLDEKINMVIENMGYTKEQAAKMFEPDFCGKIGFASYSLSLNKAEQKRLSQRIAEIESKQGRESKEQFIKGVKVVENVEENRIQLFFDGKPAAETISLLKSRGMKWSPRGGCWQRMLNNNGIYAVRAILQAL